MKSAYVVFAIWIIVITLSYYFGTINNNKEKMDDSYNIDKNIDITNNNTTTDTTENNTTNTIIQNDSNKILKEVFEPINKSIDRINKKPFWIKISKNNSPIENERFEWYHTWVDFEIFKWEENIDIKIYSICNWKIIYKNYVNWYWWVIIQSCIIDSNEVTILYWHLNIDSITLKIWDNMNKKSYIWILWKWKSKETDYERKHLHLWIHKWKEIVLLWYTQNKNDLNNWIDYKKIYK